MPNSNLRSDDSNTTVNLWTYYDVPPVLACVEDTKWRDRTVSEAWVDITNRPQTKTGAWMLMHKALQSANINDAVMWRDGNLLNASSLLYRPYGSLPIPEGQWMIEAQQLFEISLALAQFETRNIA